MTQEDGELLLRYLSMALPYKTMCNMGLECPMQLQRIFIDERDGILLDFYTNKNVYQVYLSEVKPYLRPLSSITEEERLEISNLVKNDILKNPYGKINPKGMDNLLHSVIISSNSLIKWLLEKHFDFMELIPKGLAINVIEENNSHKQYVVITQTILDYIEKNSRNFENPIPTLGEKWIVDGEFTYSGVCGGQPVIEIHKTTGEFREFMRLPKSIVKVE